MLILKAIEIDHVSGKKEAVFQLYFFYFFPLCFFLVPGQKRDKLSREAVISSVTIPSSIGLNSCVACIYLTLLKYLR